ncbi:PAS domain-containing sensor histidine kinase [uncultured Microscilla sp.]|uniref:sensor histidine kinase n=1 Tax=uncultured Microscilla sp. TaxID=432653 RepID=UPI002608B93C|nr:PAS domain-containing sensor histidine kinase [uncultured Microscilla sp.]
MEVTHLIENIVNHIDAGLFLRDVSTKEAIYYSPGFFKIWEVEEVDWNEQTDSFLNFVHPDDKAQVETNHYKFMKSDTRRNEEYRIITPKNNEKWVWVRTFPVYNTQGDLYCQAGIIEDITYKKTVEKDLTSLTKSKDEMLRMLSHDLRSPLQSILGLTQLLEMETHSLNNQDLSKYIQLIKESCNFANNLMADLLDTHSLEEGKGELNLSETKLSKLLTESCHMFEQQAIKKNISLNLIIDAAHDSEMKLDATKIIQAVNNLLSNAIKFTARHGQVTVTLNDTSDYATICVKDSGIGIPTDKIPFLFDKFTKARRAGTSGEKTTGLGMSITKNIIDQHKGEISVESKVNEGTSFIIKLFK